MLSEIFVKNYKLVYLTKKNAEYKEVLQNGSLPVIKWDDIVEEVDMETQTLEVVVEPKKKQTSFLSVHF